jgi:hypothetical protein
VSATVSILIDRCSISTRRAVQFHNANIVELYANLVLHMFVATVVVRKCIPREHVQRSILRTLAVAATALVAPARLKRSTWTLSPNLIQMRLRPLRLLSTINGDLALSQPNRKLASRSSPMGTTNLSTSTTTWLISAVSHTSSLEHTPSMVRLQLG